MYHFILKGQKRKSIIVNRIILTRLVECDKLSVQPHQVSSLRHLTDHEGDESGVTLPLLPSQRGLRQQHAGIYGVFNWGKQRSTSRLMNALDLPVKSPDLMSEKLTAEVVFGMVVPFGVIQNGWHFPAHVKLSSFGLWQTKQRRYFYMTANIPFH